MLRLREIHPGGVVCGIATAAMLFGVQSARAEFTVLGWDGTATGAGGPGDAVMGPIAQGSLGFSLTKPDSEASMSLRMIADQNSMDFINEEGEVSVKRGLGELTDLGLNQNGTGQVLGQWEEFVGETSNTIQAIWIAENGEDLLPFGSMVDGKTAFFLEWRFGGEDPIDLRNVVDPGTIQLMNAVVALSSDGGETFDLFNLTNSFSNPWDGSDTGTSLPLAGQGINMIVTQYEFTFLPSPGTAAGALVGTVLLGARRRRR